MTRTAKISAKMVQWNGADGVMSPENFRIIFGHDYWPRHDDEIIMELQGEESNQIFFLDSTRSFFGRPLLRFQSQNFTHLWFEVRE